MKKLLSQAIGAFFGGAIAYYLIATFLFTPEVNPNGEPEGPHTSTEWKIWAYSSAAPLLLQTTVLLWMLMELS